MSLTSLRTDGQRLWQSLQDMAQVGGTPDGGVCRLALTEADRLARNRLREWALRRGHGVRVDAMGNMFIRRAGQNDSLPPVLTGSHADSQPTGGRYDGIYGVLAGLEVLDTLNDHGIQTLRPLEVVNWTNEEGARFAPAMIASGVFAGVFELEYGLSRKDMEGVSLGEALRQIGYDGANAVGGSAIHAAFELHIEQGPILEAEGIDIGVVTGAQGQRWFEVELSGSSAHAGTTPMVLRRDALMGFSRVAEAVYRLGWAEGDAGRATIGVVRVSPNSRNVVPGHVFFTVEFRHPDASVLGRLEEDFRQHVAHHAEVLGLGWKLNKIFQYEPLRFDASCVAAVRDAAKTLQYGYRDILSGAGHDACYLSSVAPTSMIFIPCVGGISHNPAESIRQEWSTRGANVLLHAMLAKANEPL